MKETKELKFILMSLTHQKALIDYFRQSTNRVLSNSDQSVDKHFLRISPSHI